MGLDIRAYGGVKLVKETDFNIECMWEWAEENIEGDKFTIPFSNPYFPTQSIGISDGVYTFEDCYSQFSRSYSGYSTLREAIAKASGVEPMTILEDSFNKPSTLDYGGSRQSYIKTLPYLSRYWFGTDTPYTLGLLLNFSDCEGVINLVCCKMILEGLMVIDERHPAILEHARSFHDLKETFKFAVVNNGFVEFS